ncbi:hypothetical protein AGLY_001805 [Aphis glycines]|uniref:Uncharacterized protein n=1 Tax=Aphis glycines TaxID=307491 RepID=A0A6G0U7B6_APHGL|nr:hypothetical protein AGLY_001805 [Aphis glycines]
MLATTERAMIVALWLVCCYYDQAATLHHDHVRTRSGSTKVQRTKKLTSGMPAVTVVAGAATTVGEDGSSDTDADAEMDVLDDVDTVTDGVKATPDANTGRLRDFLFGKPNKIFKSLMRTGVKVVQRGMDAFQGVSTKVLRVARKRIGDNSSASGGSSSQQSFSKSNESGDVDDRKPVKRQAKVKKPTGFVKSVSKMLKTGLTGISHVTDLSLLLGNMGTHKLMATLDGKNGNQEMFNLIIKFIGAKVGQGTKGSAQQFIKDVGIISTFVSKNDEITKSISMLMDKFMSNPKVTKAMVRLVLTFLDSSPSTSCLLDQLPLSPQDVRMVFDIFVGSNGQMMLQTIAGLVSDLTTGPDTKAFLESALGMISMFKSDNPEAATKDSDKPTTSIVGSLTDFFTGGQGEEEDNIENKSVPPPMVNNKKKYSSVSGTISKPLTKKLKNNDDTWFGDTKTSLNSSPKKTTFKADPWFDSSETTSNLLPKTVPNSKSDDWFENRNANSDNRKVRNNGKINYRKTEVVTKESSSGSFSDDDLSKISKPTTVKTDSKITAKKPLLEDDDDIESYGA